MKARNVSVVTSSPGLSTTLGVPVTGSESVVSNVNRIKFVIITCKNENYLPNFDNSAEQETGPANTQSGGTQL